MAASLVRVGPTPSVLASLLALVALAACAAPSAESLERSAGPSESPSDPEGLGGAPTAGSAEPPDEPDDTPPAPRPDAPAPVGDAQPDEDVLREAALARAHLAAEPLGLDEDTTLAVTRIVRDGERAHVRLARWHRGLRVVGGDVVVHLGREVPAPTATLRRRLELDASGRLDAAGAASRAGALLGWPTRAAPTSELVVYARGGLGELAYEVVWRDDDHMPPREDHAFVARADGRLLDSWDAVETLSATGHGHYAGDVALEAKKYGKGAVLVDVTRGNLETRDAMNAHGTKDKHVYGAGGIFGTGSLSARATLAVDVHHGLAQTWDYFEAAHGRAGIDDAGHGLFARVHFGNAYANAFFDPACGCLAFGDGDPTYPGGAILPLASLDVVAHEVTHAITAASAGLLPSGESGALDEATSDIFATMVERRAKLPSDPFDWRIGERIRPPEGLRSMPFPERDGVSTGCWSTKAKTLDPHRSSGIGNHFFYLLSEGTGPATHTCGSALSMKGIGSAKAAAIWYRALTSYFTSDASFADARVATLQAAADLFGPNSLERARVASAWKAVKVK